MKVRPDVPSLLHTKLYKLQTEVYVHTVQKFSPILLDISMPRSGFFRSVLEERLFSAALNQK